MDKKLKKILISYTASAFCAVAMIAGAIFSEHYEASLAKTLDHLRTIQINTVKTKALIQEREAVATKVAAMIPPDGKDEAMEGAILATADAIKARMKVQVEVAAFERKDKETALPVTISGPIRHYGTFLNDMGYLQSLTSPFLFIQTVTIAKASSKTEDMITFEIKGVLKHLSGPAGNAT